MFKYIVSFIVAMTMASAQVVSSIDIRGHQFTKEFVIEREIQHPLLVIIDIALAQADRNRIEHLGFFS